MIIAFTRNKTLWTFQLLSGRKQIYTNISLIVLKKHHSRRPIIYFYFSQYQEIVKKINILVVPGQAASSNLWCVMAETTAMIFLMNLTVVNNQLYRPIHILLTVNDFIYIFGK